jgi:hypothetical protein
MGLRGIAFSSSLFFLLNTLALLIKLTGIEGKHDKMAVTGSKIDDSTVFLWHAGWTVSFGAYLA